MLSGTQRYIYRTDANRAPQRVRKMIREDTGCYMCPLFLVEIFVRYDSYGTERCFTHAHGRKSREIRRCDDADGRCLPIPHLPGIGLPPLCPLCHASGWRRRLPDRHYSLHLDGVLRERGEGGQAVVPRCRAACPR
jgi:hypothetical protein